MGLIDSVTDALTGGENDKAAKFLEDAKNNYSSIVSPTAAQLSLPELQKYVEMGIMTPAEAKTALVSGNAYNNIKVDPSSMMAEQDTLGKLKALSDAGGLTPQMKAQLTAALDQVATTTRGNNAAISDQFAQRGIPSSLMAEAAMRADSADAARNANLTATQAAGQAEQNALAALSNEGNLASTIHGQNYSEEANKAAAENAIREWNAGATNTGSENNANRVQNANLYNATNKQNVGNLNTDTANKRTEYNATVPQSVFNNAITKAGGIANVSNQQANQATQVGNQNLGIAKNLIGAGANALAPGAGNVMAMNKPAGYNPNIQEADLPGYDSGAVVPGTPRVPGDSPKNDFVHARLSPGEMVLPRSVTTNPNAPELAKGFVQHLLKNKPTNPVHPDDVHSVLEALTKRRNPPVAAARG